MITQQEVAALGAVEEPRVLLQTFRRSFEQICQGEDPWLPLGIFMHQFFGTLQHLRPELVREPIDVPAAPSSEQWRWAVFCAASVEYLCTKYQVPCPEWALNSRYSLPEPWYYALGSHLPRVQEKLCQSTPEEFARRNVFCGDRVFNNKYEHMGRRNQPETAHVA